ncbi:MAG: DEAD/DEAH box helicase [Anaerolineales bacterium]|jgi:ATP-dependent RNA helicase RhlE
MTFQEYNFTPALQRALRKEGFEQPTPVQQQAFPAALQRRDILGTAQTGTGKTVAFLLPALHLLLTTQSSKRPRMVVLAPTRELASQIADEARRFARFTPLRIATIVGGASIKAQTQYLRRGVDLVVATPGRLKDHMQRGNIRFTALEILVLDEADRMLDMGFLPDIESIVRSMPDERQTMLFSATMPAAIQSLSYRFLKNPLRIEIDTAQPPQAIQQCLYPVPKHLKIGLLLELLDDPEVKSTLIFTRTKQEADILTRKLREAGSSVVAMHGDFQQRKRAQALQRFRTRKARILVATNIAARGLDIEDISHVINYDVPDEAENYVHRIGRTARLQTDGVAWTLVTPEDEPLVAGIEYLLDKKLERRSVPGFDYDVPAPDWAKLSTKTLLANARRKQSSYEHWKALAR